jgi:hypothetical protein
MSTADEQEAFLREQEDYEEYLSGLAETPPPSPATSRLAFASASPLTPAGMGRGVGQRQPNPCLRGPGPQWIR